MKRNSAFTLTEILIVIGIIVLLMVIAIPAFSLITGGKSIEGAANQMSAAIGRARAQAIGLQKTTGVLGLTDAKSGRKVLAIVTATDAVTASSPLDVVWLDLADADFLPLPPGVTMQTIADTTIPNVNAPPPDHYIGFNTIGVDGLGATRTATVAYGGCILFDATGQIVNARYGLRCIDGAGVFTALGGILQINGFNQNSVGIVPTSASAQLLRSQLGFVLVERDLFASANGTDDDKLNNPSLTNEAAEENWLDQNSTPYLINRYTGTLIRGD